MKKLPPNNLTPTPRPMTAAELEHLRQLTRNIKWERFKADQVRTQTALVPRGQEVVAEIDAVVRVLENFKTQYIAQILHDCGYPQGAQCSIDLSTGVVTLEN